MNTITTSQAATTLGLSIRTIQRHCATGKLTATKVERRWAITVEDTVELPALTANHPQLIRSGELDRDRALTQLVEELAPFTAGQPAEVAAELVDLYREVLLRHTDAAWWALTSSYRLAQKVQKEFTAEDKARLAAIAAKRA